MIVRIDPQVKAKVSSLAKAEGKSLSQVVRDLLEEYVTNRDIGSYIDDLWGRIGSKLTSRGVKPDDIRQTIQHVRHRK